MSRTVVLQQLGSCNQRSDLCRARSLGFDTSKQINSIHKGGVTWLDLERADNRYLLAGSADCSVAVYDVAQPTGSSGQQNSGSGDYGSVLKITSANSDCHQYSVSSVAWYPIDTGLFVTGSFDHQVKVRSLNCTLPPNHCSCHQVQINYEIHHSAILTGLGCQSWSGSMQLHIPRPRLRRGNVSNCCNTLLDSCRWR